MAIIDTTLLSALVSAVVALLIVILKEFVFEPRRRRGIDKAFKRLLISAWISDMKSNVDLLMIHERHLDKLTYDDRPLDRVAMHHPELSKAMTDARREIRDLNELVDLYNAALAPQLHYLLMPDPRKAEPYAPQQGESGEIETSLRIKSWQKNWLDLIDDRRKKLLLQVENLITSLEHEIGC